MSCKSVNKNNNDSDDCESCSSEHVAGTTTPNDMPGSNPENSYDWNNRSASESGKCVEGKQTPG